MGVRGAEGRDEEEEEVLEKEEGEGVGVTICGELELRRLVRDFFF